MTLIAGLQFQGVPLLLGDFLITGSRTYSLKKLHLISHNFVVAWTGHLIVAEAVLRDVYNEFKGVTVSRERLEQFLSNCTEWVEGDLGVHLVGWLIDSEPHCFLWNSHYPQQLFYEEAHIDGSGAEVFQDMLKSGTLFAVNRPVTSAVDDAIITLLTGVCQLMSDEVLDKNNQQKRFGYAYEILFFDGERFKYVDNILYRTLDIFYDIDKDGGKYFFYPLAYKYRSFDYFSVVQTFDFNTGAIVLDALTPVFDQMLDVLPLIPGIDVSKSKGLSLISDFYCLFLRLDASDHSSFTASVVFPSSQPNLPLVVKNVEGKEIFEFKFAFIPSLYQQLKSLGI